MSNEELDAVGFDHGFSEEYEEITTINLEDLLKLINVERINYLKCDIEGAEYDFLMGKSLDCIDFLSMELHYIYLGKEKVLALIAHLVRYFNFYDGSILSDFANRWPPPAIVNLINKKFITPILYINRIKKLSKSALKIVFIRILIPSKGKVVFCIKKIKNTLPEPAQLLARTVLDIARETPQGWAVQRLKKKDYSQLPLLASTEQSILRIREAAESIYGISWNFYSDALRREIVHVFETCVKRLSSSHQTINYLEIGSCQGLSMSLMAHLIGNANALGKLVSIDPYFSEGYVEQNNQVAIDKTTRENAHRLYKSLQLDVEHIEDVSSVGLRSLVCGNQRFHLIYIDGAHEGMNPLRDLGLSLELIAENGIIMLDDHRTYPDVKGLKDLCDRHFEKVAECWKIAAYDVSGTVR